MVEAKIPANRTHQKWMLDRMKELIVLPDQQGPVGMLQPADYQRVSQVLKEGDFIKRIPDYRSFFMRWDKDVAK